VRNILLLGATALGLAAHPALAQSSPDQGPAADGAPSDNSNYHASDGDNVVVTGFRRNREDILSGTEVVSGETLARELRPTIGETLARQPGVSATSFGPNASRPVLRGMQGDRVRVLTDGIGSLDVSSTSEDHAVAINPLTADRIEVLRGPAALLFGSSVIGGVVNVIDARIPRKIPDEPVHAEGLATFGSAATERSLNAALDAPVGGHFVVHVDGNYSESDDLRIGDYVLSPALRSEAAQSADPGIAGLADLKGKLPNSSGRTWDVGAGAAYVDGQTDIGFSAAHYESRYGVPIRYSLEPGVEAEATRIDARQNRFDGRAEVDTGNGFLDSVRLRAGYADYKHDELEEDGSIGTTFTSKGLEGRLEFVQSVRDGWGGGFGAQYFHRILDVVGDEKFLPENSTSQVGLFALQSLDLGAARLEAGARYEHSKVHAHADGDIGNPALERSFDAVSASLGASYAPAQPLRIGLNVSHSQRAPTAEELFANGPHAGTQAFEVGDPDLRVEKSWGLEATLHAHGEGWEFSASYFRSWYDNFIFNAANGAVEDELPVFVNLQADARQSGFEVEGSADVAKIGAATIRLDALADYTRTTITGFGPAPRIPPLRMLGGIEARTDRVTGRVEAEWVDDQNRIAPQETPTDGHTMVNASLAFRPFDRMPETSITISANNIFDVDARRHASVLKDFAPLAGRDIRISARVSL
jgi:iron complex outermembrane receptor protein